MSDSCQLLHTYAYSLLCIGYVVFPFHSIVLFQATRPIQTKRRLGKNTESVQRKRIEAQKTKHKKHAYTTRSDFTKALLLALQRQMPNAYLLTFLSYRFVIFGYIFMVRSLCIIIILNSLQEDCLVRLFFEVVTFVRCGRCHACVSMV